jgi:regulator of sirC expression with transglutaminase-like and TPR domain
MSASAPDAGLLARWTAFLGGGDPDLFEGALLISLLIDPDEDLDAARSRVAELAGRVREDPEGLLPGLRRVLFDEEDFRGDSESYDEPSNSSVARVLARGRGMPITLSIATVEVGRLAGLRLTGVGLPGHFVVGGADLGGRYLDPFDGGTLGEPEQLAARLGQIFSAPVVLTREALRPDSTREILARVLLNLRRSWERRHRWEEALAALTLSEALEPESGPVERERGLLLLKCGRTEDAIASFEKYLAAAGTEDAEPVRRLLETVRAGRARSGEASEGEAPERKIFTLEEAKALLPRVRELTEEAAGRYGQLTGDMETERRELVAQWAKELTNLGLEIKGLWLVDFDSGAGYYCWKYPEKDLAHFHSYEEGFAGRVPLQ